MRVHRIVRRFLENCDGYLGKTLVAHRAVNLMFKERHADPTPRIGQAILLPLAGRASIASAARCGTDAKFLADVQTRVEAEHNRVMIILLDGAGACLHNDRKVAQ